LPNSTRPNGLEHQNLGALGIGGHVRSNLLHTHRDGPEQVQNRGMKKNRNEVERKGKNYRVLKHRNENFRLFGLQEGC